jgi:glycosyltransferase involved in cell wall biosynthesis
LPSQVSVATPAYENEERLLEEPKILAVVPVYNGQKFALQAIQSLLTQSYPNLRTVAIDDRSEDDSASSMLKEFSDSSQITVSRNQKNIGLAQTLNKALELVKDEEFLLVLEQDCELLNQDYVMAAFKHLRNNSDVAVVSGENVLPDNKEMPLMKRIFIHHLCEDVHDEDVTEVGFSLLKADVFRVEVLKKIGGFESASRWKLAAEEHIVSYKIRSLGYKIIKDPGLKFKAHWNGQEKLSQNLRKEAIYGRGLGWALGRMKSDLEVGESKQLRAKKVNRILQTQYVILTVLSALLLLYNPLISLTLFALTSLVYLGYLSHGALAFHQAKEELLFLITGFLRSWVYVPNFFFGLLCGLGLDFKEKMRITDPSHIR